MFESTLLVMYSCIGNPAHPHSINNCVNAVTKNHLKMYLQYIIHFFFFSVKILVPFPQEFLLI